VKRGLACAGVALLAVTAAYQARPLAFYPAVEAAGRAVAGVEERTVRVGGHTVHYLEGGDGPETVVLLHGIFAEKDHWVQMAAALTPRYRVVIPDVPGFGESTRLRDSLYDYPAQVARLEAFAAAAGLDSGHLAGSSMGGAIAGVYAAEHPRRVRTLAFLGSPHALRPRSPGAFERRVAAGEAPLVVRTPADFDRMLATVMSSKPFMPRAVTAHARAAALRDPDDDLRLWRHQWRHGPVLERALPRISVPTFSLWGDADRVFHPSGQRTLVEGLPNHVARRLSGVGHLPMLEKPGATGAAYLAFLASPSGASRSGDGGGR
jgi:pimeloyl-ACP methyl ester carboxylesterase